MGTFAVQSTGRFVAVRAADRIVLFDALGTAPEHAVPWDGDAFAFVGEHLWWLDHGRLACVSPIDTSILAVTDLAGETLIPARGANATSAVAGTRGRWA